MSDLPRVRFIEQEGRNILFADLSGIRDRATALHAIEAVKRLVTDQPQRSVLTLTTVAGSIFDAEIVQALKELAVHNKPFVRAAALVGLSGLQRVAYAAVMLWSGRKLPVFGSMDEAKRWLVAQS